MAGYSPSPYRRLHVSNPSVNLNIEVPLSDTEASIKKRVKSLFFGRSRKNRISLQRHGQARQVFLRDSADFGGLLVQVASSDR